ncbi:MAG: alanine racemase [Defluviitaleaceae bacterium]|nr:alanine racemase [Defluviitaleaceae bacterium]
MDIVNDFGRSQARIDLGQIEANIGIVRRMTGSDTAVMAVVKAGGYGHGMCEVAGAAVRAGAGWLGVATAGEGLRLREHGLRRPVLVMGACFAGEIEALLANGLTATVFETGFAEALSFNAGLAGIKANVHVKFDSGMNRLGFKDAESVHRVLKLPNLNVQGIFSHLATSDSDPEFVMEQFEIFDNATKDLGIPIRHIANSGAVLNHPSLCLDMVRVGVLMYGLAPCSTPAGAAELRELGILPALSLKSRVSQVKMIKTGESVGYGRNFVAKEDMEISTIPLGYGDGISRHLSNSGKVLVNGKFAPIVGNVCMDQFMVATEGARVYDEVVLIGEQISSEDVAGWQGSINYEVVTALSERLERVYSSV